MASWHDITDDADPNRRFTSNGVVKRVVFPHREGLHAEVDHLRWDQGHGAQVVAWGSHSPQWPRSSSPTGLLRAID